METTTLQEQTESSLVDLFANPSESDSQFIVVARAKAYLDARRAKEGQENALKDASQKLQDAELQLLRAMDGAGMKSMKLDHAGETVAMSQTSSTYYSLPAGGIDDPAILAWLDEQGGSDLLKKSIHHATFSSFCKEIVDQSIKAMDESGVAINPLHPAVKIAERRGIMLRKG